MAKAQRKRPKIAIAPEAAKVPRVASDPERAKSEFISWRLSRLDLEGAWGWSHLGRADIPRIYDYLRNCERLHLGELMTMKGTEQIPIENLEPPARKRLQEIGHDDLDELWHLRLGGKPRIWGTVQGTIFYVIWWDPDHCVCKSPKKHT
jgi:hypothetical protein